MMMDTFDNDIKTSPATLINPAKHKPLIAPTLASTKPELPTLITATTEGEEKKNRSAKTAI